MAQDIGIGALPLVTNAFKMGAAWLVLREIWVDFVDREANIDCDRLANTFNHSTQLPDGIKRDYTKALMPQRCQLGIQNNCLKDLHDMIDISQAYQATHKQLVWNIQWREWVLEGLFALMVVCCLIRVWMYVRRYWETKEDYGTSTVASLQSQPPTRTSSR